MKDSSKKTVSGIRSSAPIDPEVWLDEHGDILFRYALLRIGNAHDAEELVQETLVAALRNLDKFTAKSAIRTWLVGILRNKLKDFYRRQQRKPADTSQGMTALRDDDDFNKKGHWKRTLGKWPEDPAESLQNREFWVTFAKCMSRLPESLAQAFTLRESEQMNSEEICKTLGISASNLAVRLYRARLQLRRCLERNWFQEND